MFCIPRNDICFPLLFHSQTICFLPVWCLSHLPKKRKYIAIVFRFVLDWTLHRCPCCNQTLPRRIVQNLLVKRFECVPDIKPTFINASLIHSFPNPQDLSQLAFFITCLVFFSVGFPAKQNTKISGLGEWYSGDHCNNKSLLS